LRDRYIEGASTQVVHGDNSVLSFIKPVGQGSSRRLIDQAKNFEAGNAARVFRGLALGVIEDMRAR
jgi:hypothetical protein